MCPGVIKLNSFLLPLHYPSFVLYFLDYLYVVDADDTQLPFDSPEHLNGNDSMLAVMMRSVFCSRVMGEVDLYSFSLAPIIINGCSLLTVSSVQETPHYVQKQGSWQN